MAEPPSKKARFDLRNPSTLAAAEDDGDPDQVLELDEIGKVGLNTKRNAIKIDGYESDSSDDNFDARADARDEPDSKQPQSKDEDEQDMFADLEEAPSGQAEDQSQHRKGKKTTRFIDTADIEGQDSRSKSGGHVTADFSKTQHSVGLEHESSSDSGDDEQRDELDETMDEELGAGAKKRHAPRLDAFNMRNETEEGKFDEAGNFVRNAADPMAIHDRWLEGSTKSDIRKAKEAHEKREAERRERDIADDAVSTSDALTSLISRLHNGETVLEALARLGTSKTKKKATKSRSKKKDAAAMDVSAEPVPEEIEAETRRKEAVEALTQAADILLSRDQPEIYDTERALLMRQYARETGNLWREDSPDVDQVAAPHWEYRWLDDRDGGTVHGPYDVPTMSSWIEADYFTEGVEDRKQGTDTWLTDVDF